MFIINFLKALYYYIFIDNNSNDFPTGVLSFCGRQGTGKTISAIMYIYNLRKKYDCIFYSNISCTFSDGYIADISDIFSIVRNNKNKNIVFLLDELQNTFSSSNSKNFDESVLSLITQLRKQHIHIVATSQVFNRLAKPLREQIHTICNCSTYFKRCTTNKFYYADDYLAFYDLTSDNKMKKLLSIKSYSFFQTEELREMYDTFEIAKSLNNCKKYNRYNIDT